MTELVVSAARQSARRVFIPLSAITLATTVIVVGALTPGYRPWADAVSRLGSHDEPHALFIRLGFVAYGLLIVAGAATAANRVPARHRVLAFLFAGYGIAAIVAGIATKDPPRSAHTFTSQIHVGSTLVGGAMLIAAMALVARFAPRSTDRRIATVVLLCTLVAVVVFPFTWGTNVYGVIEIVLLTIATGWLTMLSTPAVRGSA